MSWDVAISVFDNEDDKEPIKPKRQAHVQSEKEAIEIARQEMGDYKRADITLIKRP